MAFTTWTHFEVPEDIVFDVGIRTNKNAEYDPRLIGAARMLLNVPGHMHSAWGRVSERPEKIILVSSWKCEESFAAFKNTPEYLQYWIGLSDVSSAAPVEQQIRSTYSWPHKLRRNTDIFSISVPCPVSAKTRAHLDELDDMQSAASVGFGKQHLAPHGSPPTKVWILGTQLVDGKEVETTIHICWWTNHKREEEFKSYVGPPGETRTTLVKFFRHAQMEGAIQFIEEHCDFRPIYSSQQEVLSDPSVLFKASG